MITDKEMTMVMQYYDDIGIRKKEIRSYEVSLWTLQDEFITVLKWSDVEQKGRIEEPIMTLNIDGTEEFTCKIPMYIRYKGELIENPNWYAKDEFMIVNLRKMKVILNKRTADEAVFEFLIVEVTEEHEKDILTCNIKCQGLAFHELGKIGYRVALSQETFNEIHDKWLDAEHQEGEEPIMNVDFWCGKDGLRLPKAEGQEQDPTIWYYKVEMNWYSFKEGTGRDPHKVYEEPYATNWNEVLQPLNVEEYKEKARPISVENSNIYNITQTIAETFQIYCRYEYGHDENYHINSRTIVFYNNFMQEGNVFSLTYPHSSSRVSRTMDCNDLTTKLYVLDVDNDADLSGYNSITNAGANATHEDYILNFDYLYETRGITQEQYDAIHQFQIDIKKLNEEIIPLQDMLNKYYNEKPTVDGKKTFYENSVKLDIENLTQNQQLLNSLDAKDGTNDGMITLTADHPDLGIIITTREEPYINLDYSNKGIKADTVKIYRSYNTSTHVLDENDRIYDFYFEYDDYGQPKRILGIEPEKDNEGNITNTRVYMVYSYAPHLYYESVVKTWQDKLGQDEANEEKYTDLAETIDEKIEEYQALLEEKVEEKKELIAKFEQMLGPALREGYWQPEDYKDYGNNLNIAANVNYTYNENFNTESTGMSYIFGWDTELLEDEQNIYYEQGANLERHYYPCIDLNAVFNSSIPHDIYEYSFVFNNNYAVADADLAEHPRQYTQCFRIGSQAKLMYVKKNDDIIPVVILLGAKNMTDDQLTFVHGEGHPRLSIISSTMDEEISKHLLDNDNYWIDLNGCSAVYPRARFTSLDLQPDSIKTRYNDTLLENYEDYYTTTRINENDGKLEILMTIKPEVMMELNAANNKVSIAYTLSNANTQIYLDAMAISKENAVPKVSYEVTPSILDRGIIRTLYSRLAQLVMVNDTQLKFRNAFGYISSVTLNLDKVTDDSIEVKNYKTKFEDLFSNIVAQTESMKRTENLMAASVTGTVPLSLEGIQQSFNNNIDFVTQFLDNYFDTSRCVDNKLAGLFTEAGSILGNANSVLNQITSLTVDNAGILSGFVQNVQDELTTKVHRGVSRPVEFKTGDVWLKTATNEPSSNVVARYVATMNSSDLVYETNSSGTDVALHETAGFARTYDGALASISGAALSIDNVSGEVNLLAKNHMQLGTAGDLDIIGGRTVTIAGPTINIISESSEVTNPSVGSINLIATNYSLVDEDLVNNLSHALSKVNITPTLISMASADILMRGSNTIKMVTSKDSWTSTSAIEISSDNGVWIGSGKGINLFAGDVSLYDAQGARTALSGASVQLNSDHLLLGFAGVAENDSSAAAVEIKSGSIVMAVGSTMDSSKDVTGQNGGLVGARFTRNSIGFATLRNGVVLNDNGITLGSWDSDNSSAIDLSNPNLATLKASTGSYVNIAGSGITISSGGNLYVNTPNFKVDTGNTTFATGTFGNTSIADVTELTASDTWTGVIKNSHGFFVRGGITATSLTATSNYGKFIANGNSFGLYKADGTTGILTATVDNNGNSFLTSSGKLTISAGQHFYLNAGGVIIDTAAASGNMFSISKANGGSLTLDTSGNLTVTGTINATGGSISGSLVTGSLTSATISASNISGGKISGCELDIGNGTCTISSTGILSATGASIGGTIDADNGTIGNWTIGSSLGNGSAYLGSDAIGFGSVSISGGTNSSSVTISSYSAALTSDGLKISLGYYFNTSGSIFCNSIECSTIEAWSLSTTGYIQIGNTNLSEEDIQGLHTLLEQASSSTPVSGGGGGSGGSNH